jgi:ATP-binding protein involved in chromosome partitioning
MPSEKDVLEALRVVIDPDLRRDIVSLDFVKNVKIDGEKVSFDVELTTPACPVKEQLRGQAHDAVAGLAGVSDVQVRMTSRVRGRPSPELGKSLAEVRNIIAVASGKGGVGKSTVALNLAVALHRTGASVGLMDVDIYGPSIPTMLATVGELVQGPDGLIQPIEAGGLKIMSMGFLAGPDTPVVWRGPMASKMVQQFSAGVGWGALDYLVLDLPPGTGDIQITITQSAPITGAVIVTTPQDVALGVSARGLKMFEQVQVPVLGIVENMGVMACPHCGESIRVFPGDGVEEVCRRNGVPFLGTIPLDPMAAEGGRRRPPRARPHPRGAVRGGLPRVRRPRGAAAQRGQRRGQRDLASAEQGRAHRDRPDRRLGRRRALGARRSRPPSRLSVRRMHRRVEWREEARGRLGSRRRVRRERRAGGPLRPEPGLQRRSHDRDLHVSPAPGARRPEILTSAARRGDPWTSGSSTGTTRSSPS